MPINTVTQQTPQQNTNKPRPTCHHCKKSGHHQNQCRQLKREKDQTRNNTDSANNNNGSARTNSNPNNNKVATDTKGNNINNQRDRRQNLSSHPVRHVVELTTPQRDAILEQMQRIDRLHEIDDRKDRIKASKIMLKTTQMEMSKLQPKL